MGVDSTHPLFDAMLPKWVKTKDAIDGDEAIKAKTTVYLPALSSHVTELGLMSLAGQQEYAAYRDRAVFYDAPDRTAKALAGAILRKPPNVGWPEDKQNILDNVTSQGDSLEELIGSTVEEAVGVGRIGLLVDAHGDGDPFVSTYYAHQITNWEEDIVNGRRVPVRIHLKEETLVEDPNKKFAWKTVDRYRVLNLGFVENEDETIDAEPVYFIEIYEKDEKSDEYVMVETIIPEMHQGRRLNEIPMEIINPSRTGLDPEKPPILGLVNVALSHYRNSADLEHGRHWCALPTAWAAGFPTKDEEGHIVEFLVGAQSAWITEEPSAKAGYLEFSGAGLGHIADGMKEKERQMAVLGARMLEEQKSGVEAAEAIRLRHAGEQSVLSRVSGVCSEAFTKTLERLYRWMSPAETEVGVMLNKDFNALGLDPQALTSLVQALQSGSMSYSTFFWNLKRGELIPEDRDEEEEGALLAEGIPGLGLPVPPPPVEDEPEPDDEDEPEEDDDE
jgi:hypothetical protein